MKELHAALVVLRVARGMKQCELADLADVMRALLCAYETGRQVPRLRTLDRILEALRFTYADLEEAATFVARLKERRP